MTTRTLVSLALSALIGILALAACGAQATTPAAAPASAVGDAARGETVFTSAGCAGCHSVGSDQLVGPGLAGIVNGKGPYGDKLPNGELITDASLIEWIKVGGVGKIGQMPGNNTLTDQELADIVAYLKTLE
ncbi:cytochrome c [Candidatus Gracilibacteria bacterium]|nr:cytochrome c [Candidatus Gracilibacteria bacterium]